jgi:arginyl-tRNA synthetase (EC 6.1.1.19)
LIVDLEKYNLNPALIKKTSGATLYITRDLATAAYRKKTFNFVKSLYVVGGEQTNHFKQLKDSFVKKLVMIGLTIWCTFHLVW